MADAPSPVVIRSQRNQLLKPAGLFPANAHELHDNVATAPGSQQPPTGNNFDYNVNSNLKLVAPEDQLGYFSTR
jgi:hypothetical protein